MTTDPTRLLQMLEPAVRPGPVTPNSRTDQGKAPFEARSFSDLLGDVTKHNASVDASTTQQDDAGAAPARTANGFSGLAGLGQIENATLRQLLTRSSQATTPANSTTQPPDGR